MIGRFFSSLARFVRFSPDAYAEDEPSVLRSARHNAPIAWVRIPIVLIISVWIYDFVGLWAWAIWTAVTLLVERIATHYRKRLISGDLRWAPFHIASLFALSLCWVAMAALVWRSGSDVARIAAIMGLLSLAIYGAVGGYKDRGVLAVLVGPPMIALPVFMGIDLWSRYAADIALLGTVSTGATATIVSVLGIGLHRSDAAGVRAQRKLAENIAALNENRALIEAATSAAHVGWWHMDVPAMKIHWSESIRQIFGASPDYVPTPFFAADFYAPEVRDDVLRRMSEGIHSGKGWRIVAPLRTLDGRDIWIRGTSTVVLENGVATKIIGVVQDITHEKNLQDELVEVKKFEAVGRVTTYVAHDLNNTLTAVASGAAALRRRDLDPSRQEAHLRSISDATARAGEIYNNLLSYSRMQVLKPRLTNINEAVAEVADQLRRRFGDTVTIKCELSTETPHALLDRAVLLTSLMNLGLNACEAMAHGGALRLSTRVSPASTENAAQAVIDVIDTGPGIPATILDKIFDPFFTTSVECDRSGLGLSIAQGFARQSGGALTLVGSDSGAHFAMSFPLAPDEESLPVYPVDNRQAARAVLLVEDDEMVRTALTFALEDKGFNVLAAASGEEALAALDGNFACDAVLSDVVLKGGMSGPEAASQIRLKRPDAQIIFMSGYAEDKLADLRTMEAHYLRKPFVIDEFCKLVGAQATA